VLVESAATVSFTWSVNGRAIDRWLVEKRWLIEKWSLIGIVERSLQWIIEGLLVKALAKIDRV